MTYGLLINYSVRNTFLQKISPEKCDRETSSRPLFVFFKKKLFKGKSK